MTESNDHNFRSLERTPDQTDEEWEAEAQLFLKKIDTARPKPPVTAYPATAHSWRIKPLGDTDYIPYADTFTNEEYHQLTRGLIPEQMEDKWFAYHASGSLYLHRSWTGDAIYRVKLESSVDGARVISAECATNHLALSTPNYEAKLLKFLVGNLLLNRGYPFPKPKDTEESSPGIIQHIISGTGYPEETSDD